MPQLILNAISGTGQNNIWTAGGATVGDDQSAIGGTESTGHEVSGGRLSVFFEQLSLVNISINYVQLICRLKSSVASNALRLAIFPRSGYYGWYYGDDNEISTIYQEYSYIWYTNPAPVRYVGNPWIVADFHNIPPIYAGCWASDTKWELTTYADHTYLIVDYDLGLTPTLLNFR